MLKKQSLDLKSAAAMLPVRNPDSNKGSFGKVLLICGSKNMAGCCSLATEGALRSGAGLVTLAFPDCLYTSLTSRLTENLFLPLVTDKDGFISGENTDTILSAAENSNAVMFGCGVGQSDGIKDILKSLLRECNKPLIIDADGLNCLSEFQSELLNSKADILLTPHPMEMARLCKTDLKTVCENREKTATKFAGEYSVNVLLKGKNTLIINKSADELFVNPTGNTGLSKGGAGDLLSGIIAGLTPTLKGDLFRSAVLGAFIHGLTSDILKDDLTEYSMLPTDCAAALPRAFKEILKYK